jgi:hypothetical protein
VNVFGRDPKTGFARRPIDHVGIQYGLKARNDGTITTEQFIDLNRRSAPIQGSTLIFVFFVADFVPFVA